MNVLDQLASAHGRHDHVRHYQIDPLAGPAAQSFVELVAGIILNRLLERSAAALVGALI